MAELVVVRAALSRDRIVELQQLGQLTPERVLQRASKTGSALHSLFEWDDSSAAEKFRHIQAVSVIRQAVRILQPASAGQVHEVRAIVSSSNRETSPPGSPAGQPSDLVALAKVEYWEFRGRYADVPELEEFFQLADEAITKIEGTRGLKPVQELPRRCLNPRCAAVTRGPSCKACGRER